MSRNIVLFSVASVALIAACLVSVYVWNPFPRTVTIVRTSEGFAPKKVVILKGDTIIFENASETPFWPASNAHPSHGLYPEFDAKRPVAAGESWSFVFAKAGTWGLHDHLHAGAQGTITVLGIPDEGIAGCLLRYSEDALTPQCWEADVAKAIRTKGLDAAFAYVQDAYTTQERFKRNCHDVMHLIGSAAYEEFAAGKTAAFHTEASFCGYGFYHGFIEKMLVSEGSAHYEKARAYCEYLEKIDGTRASGPCFHGIGHAVFDSLDSTIWGNADAMVAAGTKVCEQVLTEKEARIRCVSGIHNSFANAMSARSYELSYERVDPLPFCLAQKSEYQDTCLGEVVISSLREKHLSLPDSLAYISSLSEPLRTRAYYFYFSDEVKRELLSFDVETYSTTCMSLTTTARTNACILGVVQGMSEESSPAATYKTALPFCEAFPDAYKHYCTRMVSERTDTAVIHSNEYQQMCVRLWGAAAVTECRQ